MENQILDIFEEIYDEKVKSANLISYRFDGFLIKTISDEFLALIENDTTEHEIFGYFLSDDADNYINKEIISVDLVDKTKNENILERMKDELIKNGNVCFVNIKFSDDTVLEICFYTQNQILCKHLVVLVKNGRIIKKKKI